jgi:hypothetical protein
MASLLTLALAAIACLLIGVISVLFFRYRRMAARRDVKLSKEEVMGRLFLRKIKSVVDAGKDPNSTLKDLGGVMRSFFSELFEIAYEFDYVELNEELGKRGIDDSIRKDVIEYSMKTEEFQYGGKPLGEDDLSAIIQKSIIIIKSVSQKLPEVQPEPAPEASEKPPAPEAPPAGKKQSRLSAAIEGFIREPLPKREKPVHEESPKEEAAEEHAEAQPKPAESVALKRPVPEQVPLPKKMPEPVPSGEGQLPRIRKLLLRAETALSSDAPVAAEAYAELRGIYESLPSDQKRGMRDETRRIISLYNALLGEYKNSISAAKEPSK